MPTSGTFALIEGVGVQGRLDSRRAAAAGSLLLAVALALLVATGTVAPPASVPDSGPPRHVIVQALPGQERAVEQAVTRLGGRIRAELRIIHGFSASIPEAALAGLTTHSAVVAVTPDRRVALAGKRGSSRERYSMANVVQSVRADTMWEAGFTGAGVDVALIDSGVAPVQGLASHGKVLNGPDISFESQAPNLRHLDTFGHGTHMAGIIAGRDADPAGFRGMAPDARLVSIKVADSYGNTDVSQVIAAIDWVVQHAHDPGLNIRVLNLSFGTQSEQSYVLDPLALAAEVAWHRGIAVVAAAGNSGRSADTLANPAYDPYLIATGAADHRGTGNYSRWRVASFSQPGDGIRNPDIVAPGAHIQSLRVPRSYIDQKHPGGRVADRYFLGSGSSQAAAVVSGSLALMFDQHPSMTPDQAKALLEDGANRLRYKDGFRRKHGKLGLRLDTVLSADIPASVQQFPRSTGLGSLEGSRGSIHLEKDGIPLRGEQDIFGHPFDSAAMAALEIAGNSWTGGVWNGNEWTGDSWAGNNWTAVTWTGNEWTGNLWIGNEWSGNEWTGNEWTGNEWTGNEWTGNEWTGDEWEDEEWEGNEWQGDAWSSASWR
jgi:serine protease AprX